MFLEPPLETQGSVPTALILVLCATADWRRLEAVVRPAIRDAAHRFAGRSADGPPPAWRPPAWCRPWALGEDAGRRSRPEAAAAGLPAVGVTR